jgi:hypothetical protein
MDSRGERNRRGRRCEVVIWKFYNFGLIDINCSHEKIYVSEVCTWTPTRPRYWSRIIQVGLLYQCTSQTSIYSNWQYRLLQILNWSKIIQVGLLYQCTAQTSIYTNWQFRLLQIVNKLGWCGS